VTDRKSTVRLRDNGEVEIDKAPARKRHRSRPNHRVLVTFPRQQLERDLILWADAAGVTASSIIRRIVAVKLGFDTPLVKGTCKAKVIGSISVSFPKAVLDRLGYYARDRGLSMSAAVRELIARR
jgi:hypothetical protein